MDNYLVVVQTPLMLARRRGDTRFVHVLIAADARDSATPEGKRRWVEGAVAAPLSAAAAIQRALLALIRAAEESVSTFRRHASRQDCVSCHQQQLPLGAVGLAASHQFIPDPAVERRQVDLLRQSISTTPVTLADARFTASEMKLESMLHPESAITEDYTSLHLQLALQPATAATDALVHHLAVIQNPDGRWSWILPRPPIQASDITDTAQALHTLQTYPIPARRSELKRRVHRAHA